MDAACVATERLGAPLIVVATDSGRTALALSNRRPVHTGQADNRCSTEGGTRSAPRCRAHLSRTGKLCRGAAIRGGTVCTADGRNAPQVREAARLRMALSPDQAITVQTPVNMPEVHLASMGDADLARYKNLFARSTWVGAGRGTQESAGTAKR